MVLPSSEGEGWGNLINYYHNDVPITEFAFHSQACTRLKAAQ